MVSPGGATTYPVRFKLEVDDSALRQAVVNSRAFIETNVTRRTAGDTQMSMGRQMVSDYGEGMRQRAFSPVNQMMQGLFQGLSDSAPGGASWTNRTNMMMGTLGLEMNRVFKPDSFMPRSSYLANIALTDKFNPDAGGAAFSARQEVMRSIAGMATTTFSGDQSGSRMIKDVNAMHFNYDYQARYTSGTIAEMNRMGMMGSVQNRSNMMALIRAEQDTQSMRMAMGLDERQSAMLLGNLTGYAGPGNLKSGVEGYMLAKTAGADMGQLNQSIAEQSRFNANAQRVGAGQLAMSTSQVSENAALASIAVQGASTMIDPTTKGKFFTSPEVEAAVTDTGNQYARYNPAATTRQKLSYIIQNHFGTMTAADQETLTAKAQYSLDAGTVQNKIDARNVEKQKQMEEGISFGGAARAFARGSNPQSPVEEGSIGTQAFNERSISESMSTDKLDFSDAVSRDRATAGRGGLSVGGAIMDPGMAMERITEGFHSGFEAAGDAWRKSDGFFSGVGGAISAGFTAERRALFGTTEGNEAKMRMDKYNKDNQVRQLSLKKGLNAAVGAKGASDETVFAAAGLLSHDLSKDDMKLAIEKAGGADSDAVKLYNTLKESPKEKQAKIIGALKPYQEAVTREQTENAMPTALNVTSQQIQEQIKTGGGSAAAKAFVAGAIDSSTGAPDTNLLRMRFDELKKKDQAGFAEISGMVDVNLKQGGVKGDSTSKKTATEGVMAGSDKELFSGAAQSLTDAAAKLNKLSELAANPNRGGR